jgi:hypothetical protein
LTVINFISHVKVLGFKEVHNWEDLSVIWDKSLSNGIRACHKGLEDFQSNSNDFWVSSVQSCLDWDNKLWDDWQNFSSTFFKHIKNTLNSEESVRINFFSNTFEEDW